MMDKLFLRLFWHFFWAGTLFHSGKSGQQKVAEQQTAQDTTQANVDTKAAQGTFSQFEGPVQNSPFYKALLTTGIQDTSRAYDTARSNMRARANQAGFGYNQPVSQGAENQVNAAETSALAQVPQTAMTEAAPLSMEAGKDSASLGTALGDQAFNWNNSAYNMNKKRGSLFNTLLNTGIGAGSGIGELALMGAI